MFKKIQQKSRKIISKSLETKFSNLGSPVKIAEIHDKIIKEFLRFSNPIKKNQIEKYMKHTTLYRGISSPQITMIFRRFWKEDLQFLGNLSEKTDLAEIFLRSSYGEDKCLGMMIYGKVYKEIEIYYIEKTIKSFFVEKFIVDWAMTDSICCKFLKYWGTISKENTLVLSKWKNEENIWLKRASCVSFVNRAKHGDKPPNFDGFLDILFEICRRVIECQERFAQLGCGWLLREISLADKEKVKEFALKELDLFTREGLSYAVEKMNEIEARKLLERRKKLTKK